MEQNIQEVQSSQEAISMKLLLEAGVHFGSQPRRWHPKMKPYIFTQRNGIHIIDLQKTMEMLNKSCGFVRKVAADGGKFLFVGTKKQAQETVEQEAKRCGMFYVNQRWLGGTLTNFTTLQSRIDYLVRLEDRKLKGEFALLPKEEARRLEKEIVRLNRYMGGIKEMTKLPNALFIVDPVKEKNAIAEAKRMAVPVVAIVDTDCNPELIDHPIPGNDDGIRSIKLLCGRIADAVLAGLEEHRLTVVAAQELPQKAGEGELVETPATPPAPENPENKEPS
ncbi:MAG: 30S ribosomal protein S2 [Chloroflexi bacterium]|nr:30S ribosomal protein S2 [Chloroflexota bacterium]